MSDFEQFRKIREVYAEILPAWMKEYEIIRNKKPIISADFDENLAAVRRGGSGAHFRI